LTGGLPENRKDVDIAKVMIALRDKGTAEITPGEGMLSSPSSRLENKKQARI